MSESVIYWLPCFLAGLISSFVAFNIWRRRTTSGAKALTVLIAAAAWWAFLSVIHRVSPELSTKILLAKIQYLGILTVPLALLVFVLQYTGREKWVNGRNLALLSIFPLVTIALVWTNEVHQLIWTRVRLDFSGPIVIGVYSHGPWFWAQITFSYLLLLTGTVLLIQTFIHSQRLYRMQILIMLTGMAVPWLTNVLYITRLSPWPNLDLTPIAFNITGLVLAWGMFRFHISDVIPVARETVLENIPDGVFVLDMHNRVVGLNLAAQNILDLHNSEVIGQPASQVFVGWSDFIESYRDATKTHSEIILGGGDSQRNFNLRISPLKDNLNRVIGRLITLHDFTERKQEEEELRKHREHLEELVEERTAELKESTERLRVAKDAAEAANRAKSNFLSSMSHELRTPLNAVIGFSEVLRDRYFGELNKKQAEYVNDILESGKHLLFLINDILDISNIEAGEVQFEPSKENIKKLLENSLSMIREKCVRLGINISTNIAQDLEGLEITADKQKLKQVMFNLLSNAVKFTPHGGTVTIEAKRVSGSDQLTTGDFIEISVADTGIGIAPENQEKIFDDFYQIKGDLRDKTPGTGLGLPLTKRLIEMHGGRIWVESKGEGKGSRFSFVLPIKI